jgi:hypothetical protein
MYIIIPIKYECIYRVTTQLMDINSVHALCGINIASAMCQRFDFIWKFLIHNLIALHDLESKKDQKLYIKLNSLVTIYRMYVMNTGYCIYFHGLYCDSVCKIHIQPFISFINGSTALFWALGSGLLFSFVIIFSQTVVLLGRVISPSQGHYLNTGQHKHRINAHTYIHALSGIRTKDPSDRASEDSSCLRPRGHCDRHVKYV